MLGARRWGVTIQEMADELGVHSRTIRRDLATFSEVGFPVREHAAERGRKQFTLHTPGSELPLSFAVDEALALYLGRRFMEPLAGTLLWEASQSAFQKIRACLGKSALAYLEKISAHVHQTSAGAGDYSRRSEQIDQLLRGIEDRRVTHLAYRSQRATEAVSYEVSPYGLAYHRGSLYLVAYSRDHDEVRHFKVDRVEQVEVSPFPFHLPEAFSLQKHLESSFGVYRGEGDVTVVVRFAPAVSRYVQESRWHQSQKLKQQKDGSLLATFRLSDSEEIKHWLYSFGRQAEVIEPRELRKEMAAELAEMVALYEPTKEMANDQGPMTRK